MGLLSDLLSLFSQGPYEYLYRVPGLVNTHIIVEKSKTICFTELSLIGCNTMLRRLNTLLERHGINAI